MISYSADIHSFHNPNLESRTIVVLPRRGRRVRSHEDSLNLFPTRFLKIHTRVEIGIGDRRSICPLAATDSCAGTPKSDIGIPCSRRRNTSNITGNEAILRLILNYGHYSIFTGADFGRVVVTCDASWIELKKMFIILFSERRLFSFRESSRGPF